MPKKRATIIDLIDTYYRGDAHIHSSHHNTINWQRWKKEFDEQAMVALYRQLNFEFMVLVSHSSNPEKPRVQPVDSAVCAFLTDMYKYIHAVMPADICNVLVGVEANIMYDPKGQLLIDVPDTIMAKLDIVLASRHTMNQPFASKDGIDFEKDPTEIKQSLLMAIANKHVRIIGHPDRYSRVKSSSGKYWKAYWSIWPDILRAMKQHNVAFELNISSPPSTRLMQLVLASTVKIFISSDAHYRHTFAALIALRKFGSEIVAGSTFAQTKKVLAASFDTWKIDRRLSEKTWQDSQAMLLQLVYWVQYLQKHDVPKARVVNSSYENMKQFIARAT